MKLENLLKTMPLIAGISLAGCGTEEKITGHNALLYADSEYIEGKVIEEKGNLQLEKPVYVLIVADDSGVKYTIKLVEDKNITEHPDKSLTNLERDIEKDIRVRFRRRDSEQRLLFDYDNFGCIYSSDLDIIKSGN